jgi:thioredoxin-like negative regulator of GroEL
MVAPILEELAKEYNDQIYIYKVDTEKEQELAGAFGIRSIPSILFVPKEGQPQMAMGALPKASFKDAIDKVLLGKE